MVAHVCLDLILPFQPTLEILVTACKEKFVKIFCTDVSWMEPPSKTARLVARLVVTSCVTPTDMQNVPLALLNYSDRCFNI